MQILHLKLPSLEEHPPCKTLRLELALKMDDTSFKKKTSVKWCWLHFQAEVVTVLLLLLSLFVGVFFFSSSLVRSGSFIPFKSQSKPSPLTTTIAASHPSDQNYEAFWDSELQPLQFLT